LATGGSCSAHGIAGDRIPWQFDTGRIHDPPSRVPAGLKDEGYVEGQNVIVEYRWAEDQNSRLPPLAAELVRRQVKVIVAGGGSPSALAAKAATATVPIVFATAVDPVAIGLVKSLDRPGGNLTGVTNMNVEIGPKRLELLRELLPKATTIAVLVNPSSRALAERFMQTLQPAARTFGMQLHVLNASTKKDLDAVFAALAQHQANALLICPDVFLTPRSNSSPR
jgi:putative ABC transport system substrate-binding protein